jgi:hypothetical protein
LFYQVIVNKDFNFIIAPDLSTNPASVPSKSYLAGNGWLVPQHFEMQWPLTTCYEATPYLASTKGESSGRLMPTISELSLAASGKKEGEKTICVAA